MSHDDETHDFPVEASLTSGDLSRCNSLYEVESSFDPDVKKVKKPRDKEKERKHQNNHRERNKQKVAEEDQRLEKLREEEKKRVKLILTFDKTFKPDVFQREELPAGLKSNKFSNRVKRRRTDDDAIREERKRENARKHSQKYGQRVKFERQQVKKEITFLLDNIRKLDHVLKQLTRQEVESNVHETGNMLMIFTDDPIPEHVVEVVVA